jgi:hypothetical protein
MLDDAGRGKFQGCSLCPLLPPGSAVVQDQLAAHARDQTQRQSRRAEPARGLAGRCSRRAAQSSQAVKGRHYRYYVSAALITAPLGRYEGRVGITALHRLRGVGKTALTMTWVTTSGRTGCRGLQGFLFQVDVSEIVVHEGDEPDALVGNRHDLA